MSDFFVFDVKSMTTQSLPSGNSFNLTNVCLTTSNGGQTRVVIQINNVKGTSVVLSSNNPDKALTYNFKPGDVVYVSSYGKDSICVTGKCTAGGNLMALQTPATGYVQAPIPIAAHLPAGAAGLPAPVVAGAAPVVAGAAPVVAGAAPVVAGAAPVPGLPSAQRKGKKQSKK